MRPQLVLAVLLPLAIAHTENDINLEIDELSLPDLATLDALNPPSKYPPTSLKAVVLTINNRMGDIWRCSV
jgi:hypothetical protein